jgi:hypothetical protein
MKAYRGSRGIAPLIHDLTVLFRGKEPQYPLNMRLGGPQSGLLILEKRKISYLN